MPGSIESLLSRKKLLFVPIAVSKRRGCRGLSGRVLLALGLVTSLLAGCSISPVPLSDNEVNSQALDDRAQIANAQPAPEGPVTLREAVARALIHNLDYQLEVTQQQLRMRELELSRYQMLPRLVSNLGFSSRSNQSGANSRSLLTGAESLVSSTSSNRDLFTGDLNLSWNVLDFGVSYVRSQQAANQVMLSEEQQRKVVHRLVREVRLAYWQAVSYDRVIERLELLLVEVDDAINDLAQVEQQRLDRPLTVLTYQRELISIKRELEKLQRELSLAKIKLASLMNLSPGQDFRLSVPAWFDSEQRSNPMVERELDRLGPDELEIMALTGRSELRELYYEKRINAGEVRVALLELLPGISFNYGANHNNNTFLYNNNWLSYGSQVSWNLMNVFKMPAAKQVAKARDQLLDARRMALSMAVLTQVHVSLAQYGRAKEELTTAGRYLETQSKILDQIVKAEEAKSVSRQALIREKMNTLVAEVKFDIAYADLENAHANGVAASGADPTLNPVGDKSLQEVMDELGSRFSTPEE